MLEGHFICQRVILFVGGSFYLSEGHFNVGGSF